MNSEEKADDKLSKKTAKSQFEVYLEYLKKHEVLRMGWVMQRSHVVELNEIWDKMLKELNESGGPAREMSHWKKVFTEWKSHTRRKLKYNRYLNEIEKSLIEITGMSADDIIQRKPRQKKAEPKEVKTKVDISNIHNDQFRRVITNEHPVQNKQKAVVILQEGPKIKQVSTSDPMIQIKHEKEDHSYEQQSLNETETASTIVNSVAITSEKSNITVNGQHNGVINCNDLKERNVECKCKKAKIDTEPPMKKATRDFCVQTPPTSTFGIENTDLNILRQDGHYYMGNAILTVSRSINRYCDILEKQLV